MAKILIEVSGGVVDAVWCDTLADIFILDHDVNGTTEDEFEYEERFKESEEFKKELKLVY